MPVNVQVATKSDLLDVLESNRRSVVELAVPSWQPGLIRSEFNQSEKLQRTVFTSHLGKSMRGMRIHW